VLSNTFFKLPPRRIPKRYRNAIKSVKTYPEADVHSDHNPLVCKMEVKLRLFKIERPNNIKINIRKLHNPDIKQQLQLSLSTSIKDINRSTVDAICM